MTTSAWNSNDINTASRTEIGAAMRGASGL
jgi:hypothetical protein